MLVEIILNKSKNKENNTIDRKKVGYFSGIIGVVLNLILALFKLFIGIVFNSISVLADSINNLTDTLSSVITVLGFKFSSVPADKDHPYGHGRVEYITTLIMSMFIILVGFQFAKSSFNRIINPVKLKYNYIVVVFLVISILMKIWLWYFNNTLSKKINSSILKATAMDNIFDSVITSIVVISIVFSKNIDFPVDGIIGVVVSLFIFYSGFSLAKEMISQLIGESPSEEYIKKIVMKIESYDDVIGVHNYTFHRYGHLKTIATVDIELPYNYSLVKAHNLMSVIEKDIYDNFEITLITHVEPVGGKFTKKEKELKIILEKWISEIDFIKSVHDFAIYKNEDKYFVGIQIVVDGNKINKVFSESEIKRELREIILDYDKELNTSIDILYDYI